MKTIRALQLCAFAAVLCCVYAQSTLVLQGVIRDQSPRHFPGIDFERPEPIPPEDHGMLLNNLPQVSRIPTYAFGNNPSTNKTVMNATSFNTFFNPSARTIPITVNLTLQQSNVPNLYTFTDWYYFPLTGLGWDVPAGSDEYENTLNDWVNFHFCLQVHASFAYGGGETFTFLGDDDLWVYINYQLALDLGGPHTAQPGSFALDALAPTFNMQVGNTYPFDFFYCERHTVLSQIVLTSTLQITCTYYDWCDVCEGDGQSCCQPGDCPPSDACHVGLCAVSYPPSISCQNLPLNCTNLDICHTAHCSVAAGGCVQVENSCTANGANLCTPGSCDPNQGGCIYPQKQCPSQNGVCQTGQCIPSTGLCQYTNLTCNDNNACTSDWCDPQAGCQHTPIPCAGNNACQTGVCNNQTGVCAYTNITCASDNNPCTYDTCIVSEGGCVHIPKNCNDGMACTNDTCGPSNDPTSPLYCLHSLINCTGTDKCQSYSCNNSTGCVSTSIAASCTNQGNVCNIPGCSPTQGCTVTPLPAAQCNACQNNGQPLITCDQSNKCAPQQCQAPNGKAECVYYANVTCSGNSNMCNTYQCNPSTGLCDATPIPCNTSDPCMEASCNPATGVCSITPKSCPTLNACTNNTCVNGQCVPSLLSPTCQTCGNSACITTDPCSPVVCNQATLTCETQSNPCLSSNLCVQNVCTPGPVGTYNYTCSYPPIPLPVINPCFPTFCNSTTGATYVVPVNCSDGILCNINYCNNMTGQCVKTINPCNDNNSCTVDSCNNDLGGCVHTPLPCPDNVCATGSCDNTTVNGCVYTPRPCAATNASTNYCASTTCSPAVGCLNSTRICVLSQEKSDPSHWTDPYPTLWNPQGVKSTDCFQAVCDYATQKCVISKNSVWGSYCGATYLTSAARAGVISAGVIAGVVIAAVVFAALAGFGAKKGYDAWVNMRDERMGAAAGNPLYNAPANSGNSPLYA